MLSYVLTHSSGSEARCLYSSLPLCASVVENDEAACLGRFAGMRNIGASGTVSTVAYPSLCKINTINYTFCDANDFPFSVCWSITFTSNKFKRLNVPPFRPTIKICKVTVNLPHVFGNDCDSKSGNAFKIVFLKSYTLSTMGKFCALRFTNLLFFFSSRTRILA